jgi:sugar phosphate isomerase/epimerase
MGKIENRDAIMKPCVSEATTMPCTFAEDVEHFADADCRAMEVWLTKLETHLDTHSASDTQAFVRDHGVSLVAASYQGGLLLSQGEPRKAHYDHFKRRLDLCQSFAIPTLVLVADFVAKIEQTDLERAVASLAQAARWAQAFDVTLALEFRGKNTFCASMDTALALLAQCGEPNVGLCLDVFQFYTGPSKIEDFDLLTASRLAHVQMCDLGGVPRELATDADRIFPGEGELRLGAIVERLKAIGYTGFVSLEMMNPFFWRSNPGQLIEMGMKSLKNILGEEQS